MKRPRLIAGVGVGIATIVGIPWLLSARAGSEQTGLQYVAVERGGLEVTVSSTGTVAAKGVVEIGAQVSADLKAVHVDFNEQVEKGQVLAEFDTALLRAELQKADASRLLRQAAQDKAEADYARNLPLFDQGFVSATELEDFELARQSARAELKSAVAGLRIAQANQGYATIRSPIDGIVIERNVEEGQTLVAKMETPILFVIAEDLSQVEIEVEVDESDIGQIREGQAVRFTVGAYPDDTFAGTVRQVRIQAEIVQNVVNYPVIVDASNEGGRLLPGMTATVDFIVEQREDVLLVPNEALLFRPSAALLEKLGEPPEGEEIEGPRRRRRPEGARLFLDVGDSRIRPVFFAKGISDGRNTEIPDGGPVQEGMRVAVADGANGESRVGPAEREPRRGFGRGPPLF